jgi:hypothetical protein
LRTVAATGLFISRKTIESAFDSNWV